MEEQLKHARVDVVIGIDKADVVTRDLIEPGIACYRLTLILLLDDSNARISCCNLAEDLA